MNYKPNSTRKRGQYIYIYIYTLLHFHDVTALLWCISESANRQQHTDMHSFPPFGGLGDDFIPDHFLSYDVSLVGKPTTVM